MAIGEAGATAAEEAKATRFRQDAVDSAQISVPLEDALNSPLGICQAITNMITKITKIGGMKTLNGMNTGIPTTPPTTRSRETIPGEGTRQSLSPVSPYLP